MADKHSPTPSILAPAGNKAAFLAALAAEADAIYCGLRKFSARMEAKNFSIEELTRLVRLAHEKEVQVFVTLNTLVKPGELDEMGRVVDTLVRHVKPDGLIVQDLAVIRLARQLDFPGEIHLSTLANVSFPAALKLIGSLGDVDRVVLPRELNIDEIKAMAKACPQGLGLEVFVHGALCYSVSGRCYWSSYLGGKSGLRGRCVQPCRRLYKQDGPGKRYFSCRDLSVDVLAKVLKDTPEVSIWKIEGRKKGPHYVYYTVQAYRLLRDQGADPAMKKTAPQLLEMALGRSATHYNFLPQRPQNPVAIDGQTGSGFLVGSVKGSKSKSYFIPRIALLSGDVLRVGYEDDQWHAVYRIRQHIPKNGKFFLNPVAGKAPKKGAPIFLTDRREKALTVRIRALERELVEPLPPPASPTRFRSRLTETPIKRSAVMETNVYRRVQRLEKPGSIGVWLSERSAAGLSKEMIRRIWWWLPPVIWPDNQDRFFSILNGVRKKGARRFVLNAPWQRAFFTGREKPSLWAGPFCNVANALGLKAIASLGIDGAIVSPELGGNEYFELPKHSPVPVGIVISGNWPLCVSRILSEEIKTDKPFASPRGEQAWTAKYGDDFWIFPNWILDISENKKTLQQAGYKMFVHLVEPVPRAVKLKKRQGLWNWKTKLA